MEVTKQFDLATFNKIELSPLCDSSENEAAL